MKRAYVVVWRGSVMHEGAKSTIRQDEVGRLFTACRLATVWPTYNAARSAMRRAITAWGRDKRDVPYWKVVALRPTRGGR